MSQRKTVKPPEPEPDLRVSHSQLDREIEVRLELGQHLLDRQVSDEAGVVELRRDFFTWDEFNEQLFTKRFTTGKVAEQYTFRSVVGFGGTASPYQLLEWTKRDIERQMRKLNSIRQQLPLYDSVEGEGERRLNIEPSAIKAVGNDIFLVHGHDDVRKMEVADFVEHVTGRRPTILHEQPNQGRTIIEKFEDHALEAGFAVVLLTADDVGRSKTASKLLPRTRQNVILELGFFIGALGRGRVAALYEAGVEEPSDMHGVLYTSLAGNWKFDLAKEMKAAKIDVELNKAVDS